MAMPSRIFRYSGSERPACRMNHTGVCGTVSPRQARRNAESSTAGFTGFVTVAVFRSSVRPVPGPLLSLTGEIFARVPRRPRPAVVPPPWEGASVLVFRHGSGQRATSE